MFSKTEIIDELSEFQIKEHGLKQNEQKMKKLLDLIVDIDPMDLM